MKKKFHSNFVPTVPTLFPLRWEQKKTFCDARLGLKNILCSHVPTIFIYLYSPWWQKKIFPFLERHINIYFRWEKWEQPRKIAPNWLKYKLCGVPTPVGTLWEHNAEKSIKALYINNYRWEQ